MEDETLTAKAESFKNKGNDEFKKGNFEAAVALYTEAIGKSKIAATNLNF